MMRQFFSLVAVLLAVLIQSTRAEVKLPAFIKLNRAKYTPLLFFKVPMGQMPECKLLVSALIY